MRSYLPLILFAFLAPATAAAIEIRPMPGDRIGVMPIRGERHAFSRSIADALPSYLVTELRRAGYDAHRVDRPQRSHNSEEHDDFYIELSFADVDGGDYGGVGVGHDHVGAEVSVVAAHLSVDVRIYDAGSDRLVDSLELDATAVTPTVTGVGVGGRDGYLFLSLPFFEKIPYRVAAKKIARAAANELGADRATPTRVVIDDESEDE
jgi:hypothetical protein